MGEFVCGFVRGFMSAVKVSRAKRRRDAERRRVEANEKILKLYRMKKAEMEWLKNARR